ncbi:hypothetical protein V4S56_21470, partial [Citrobacter freundii]
VNVQWRLTAASLATQAPGGKIVAARFIRLIPSACRVGVSLQRSDFQLNLFCCSDQKRRW